MTGRKVPLPERFWAKVDVKGPDDCWEWTASRDGDGYGHIKVDGKVEGAQRVAFYLTHGYWPQVGRHTCDNPPCCNPAHVIDGTHGDNQRDAYERGLRKHHRGEQNPNAKLDPEKAETIRKLHAEGATLTALAEQFGVDRRTVGRVISGKIWTNL